MKKSLRSIKPLNSRGISHLLVPLLVVVTVAVGGTYMLVASHADPPCSKRAQTSGACKKSAFTQLTGAQAPGAKLPSQSCNGTYVPSTGKCVAANAVPACASNYVPSHGTCVAQSSGSSSSSSSSSSPSSSSSAGASGSVSATAPSNGGSSSVSGGSAASYKARPDPTGDIVVTTYLNDPSVDAKGGKDTRLGGVKVKVERVGGANSCDNRKSDTGTTFSSHYVKHKDGTKVLNRGNIHYLNCNTGKYKATLIGRKGYTAHSPSTREFTLSNNETQLVWFSLDKASSNDHSAGR